MKTLAVFVLGYSSTMCVGILALAQWMRQLESELPGSGIRFREWWNDRPKLIRMLEMLIAWVGGVIAVAIFR